MARVLVVDNYGAFVYNLVQGLGEHGALPIVHRSDALTVQGAEAISPDAIVISPGPGRPEAAGESNNLIRAFGGRVSIFGVCLGHHCIAQVFGAEVVRAGRVMHGKTELVHHAGSGVFSGLPSPLMATRYDSLVVDRATVPGVLEITAETDDGVVMGLRHRLLAIEGIQFDPVSILTVGAGHLLANFLQLAGPPS